MPAVIVSEVQYNKDDDTYFISSYNFTNSFPQIKEGYTLFGELESCRIDKKVEKEISRSIEVVVKERSKLEFDHKSKELIKEQGITPSSWICLIVGSYSEAGSKDATKYPIYPEYFEILEVPEALKEEIENKFKGSEEIMMLLRFTGIADELNEAYEFLKNAYSKYRKNNFPNAKTETRKVLQPIKEITQSWRAIDNSKHLAEGINSLTKSLFSLGSGGGPHPGPAGPDETEVIFNSTLYLFKYINKIIEERRFEEKSS